LFEGATGENGMAFGISKNMTASGSSARLRRGKVKKNPIN